MKIAFLSRYQDKVSRGAENFVEEITQRLSDKFEVEVLSDKDSDDLKKILDGKYDLVIPINGRMQTIKVSLGRLFGRYKLLITGHSGQGWDDILNIALAKPDVFVALTDHLADWAKKWAWGTKVVKIPNGVDLNKFSPNGGKMDLGLQRPVILCVGALVWYKHHERAIEAVSGLSSGSLLIVGDGEKKQKLTNIGERLLGKRFKIEKFNYEDMPKVYRSCDLFTLPSWDREAFGLVYLEAMASGLGVVAPDDLSRREIIRDAGIFVDVNDSGEYSKALEAGIKTEWGFKPINQAKLFSWGIISKKYEELFSKILDKTG